MDGYRNLLCIIINIDHNIYCLNKSVGHMPAHEINVLFSFHFGCLQFAQASVDDLLLYMKIHYTTKHICILR